MKLRSLTNKELQDEILWRLIDVRVRELESSYEGQPPEERKKEYKELHIIYKMYYNEAHRRGLG